MNDLLIAAGLHDAETWERQRPVQLYQGDPDDGPPVPVAGGDLPCSETLAGAANFAAGVMVVYPSGLVRPAASVPWFWESEDELRYGSITEAHRYFTKIGVAPATVLRVTPDRVHGMCVRYEGDRPELNGRDYRLIQARPFPEWARPRLWESNRG